MNISEQILVEIGKAFQLSKDPAFSYERVSTEDQKNTGFSLEDQGDRAKQYAKEKNLYIVYTFSAAESAFKEGRILFNRMLDLAQSFNIKHLIFKNTDRLGRNDVDWPRLKKFARNEGFKIHLYEFNTIFHSDSKAEEEWFLDGTSTMAKYWSNKISQGVKGSYLKKVEKGIAPMGTSPIGYKYDSKIKKHVVDESRKNLINYIFDTFDGNNMSLDSLVDNLNALEYKTLRGGKWNRTTLYRVLTSRFYTGEFEYKGDYYKGNHEAYISKSRLDKRLKKLGIKNRAKKKRQTDYLFKGLLKSGETGRTLTGTTQNGAHKSGEYIYYVSYKPDYVSIREKEIFGLLQEEIDNTRYNNDFADLMKSIFKSSVIKKSKEQKESKSFISKKIAKMEAEQKRLLQLLIEGVDNKTIKIKMDENRKTIDSLEDQYKRLRLDEQNFIFHTSDIIDYIKRFPDIYDIATEQEKIALLQDVADEILVYKDHISIAWKKPLSFILNPEVLRYIRTDGLQNFPLWVRDRKGFVTLIRDSISPEWQLWFAA